MEEDEYLIYVYEDEAHDGQLPLDQSALIWMAYRITNDQLMAIRDILRDSQVVSLSG